MAYGGIFTKHRFVVVILYKLWNDVSNRYSCWKAKMKVVSSVIYIRILLKAI